MGLVRKLDAGYDGTFQCLCLYPCCNFCPDCPACRNTFFESAISRSNRCSRFFVSERVTLAAGNHYCTAEPVVFFHIRADNMVCAYTGQPFLKQSTGTHHSCTCWSAHNSSSAISAPHKNRLVSSGGSTAVLPDQLNHNLSHQLLRQHAVIPGFYLRLLTWCF